MNYWVNEKWNVHEIPWVSDIYYHFHFSIFATLFLLIFSFFLIKEIFHFPIMQYTNFSLQTKCRRVNKHFDVHLRRIRYVHFSRIIENTRPMGEEVDGWIVYSPPESAFPDWCTSNVSTFLYLYLNLACKQICFPPRKMYKYEKGKYKKQEFELILSIDDNIQYSWFPTFYYSKLSESLKRFSFSKKIIKC